MRKLKRALWTPPLAGWQIDHIQRKRREKDEAQRRGIERVIRESLVCPCAMCAAGDACPRVLAALKRRT